MQDSPPSVVSLQDVLLKVVPENLGTFMTFLWFLSSINHLVSAEAGELKIGFVSYYIFIRFLSRVSYLMCTEV